jgi:hypothetical protein
MGVPGRLVGGKEFADDNLSQPKAGRASGHSPDCVDLDRALRPQYMAWRRLPARGVVTPHEE